MNSRSWKHIFWILEGAALAFGLPFVFVSTFKLRLDIFYVILTACSAAFIWYYAKSSQLKLGESLKPGWALGTIMGTFAGLTFFSMAFSTTLTALPRALHLAILPLLWRGLVYGLISAVLISVFPFMVTWRALAGANPGAFRKLTVTLVALIAVGFTSFLYNMGMFASDERSLTDQFKKSILASVPTIISGSPLAAPISSIFLQMSETVVALERADNGSPRQTETARSKSTPGGID